MAPLQYTCYLEIISYLILGSLGGDSSTFSSTSSSLSRSNTTFDTGLYTMLFPSTWSTLPIFSLTLRTNPFWSQNVWMTLHTSQSFLMVFASCRTAISPTFKFVLVFVYFFLSWGDCKNSFLQQHQNSFTRFRLLRLYKSGLEKSPRGGKIIFDFMVRWSRQGQTAGRITNVVSCQESGIQDYLCLCH